MTQVDEISYGTTERLSYMANTMPADALATSGARASAGMVLTPQNGLFHLQHQKSCEDYIDGLGQERRNSSALAMELSLSCTNPLTSRWYRNSHCKDTTV